MLDTYLCSIVTLATPSLFRVGYQVLWSSTDSKVKVNLAGMFFMGPLVQRKLASWIYAYP